MQDLTLQMFLTQEIACSQLDAADMALLSGFDMPDGKSTLADRVDPGSFEHIRLRLQEKTPIDVIKELIKGYYQKLGYDIESDEDGERYFSLILDLSGARLTVTVVEEDGNILNITAV